MWPATASPLEDVRRQGLCCRPPPLSPHPRPCGERMFSQQTQREMHLGPGLRNWEEASSRHGWSSSLCGSLWWFREHQCEEPSRRLPPTRPLQTTSEDSGGSGVSHLTPGKGQDSMEPEKACPRRPGLPFPEPQHGLMDWKSLQPPPSLC